MIAYCVGDLSASVGMCEMKVELNYLNNIQSQRKEIAKPIESPKKALQPNAVTPL